MAITPQEMRRVLMEYEAYLKTQIIDPFEKKLDDIRNDVRAIKRILEERL